jgi:hypothetical protein
MEAQGESGALQPRHVREAMRRLRQTPAGAGAAVGHRARLL